MSLMRGSDRKRVVARFNSKFGRNILSPNSHIAKISFANDRVYVVHKENVFLEIGDLLIPSLHFSEIVSALPRILVDKGAIPHICSGADVMAPGVRGVQGRFSKKNPVLVVDEVYGKALAVGVALIDSNELHQTVRGKVVKNLHHVGDKVWDLIKEMNQSPNR